MISGTLIHDQLGTLMHVISFFNYDFLNLFEGSFTIVKSEINAEIFLCPAVNQKGLLLSLELVDAWEPNRLRQVPVDELSPVCIHFSGRVKGITW